MSVREEAAAHLLPRVVERVAEPILRAHDWNAKTISLVVLVANDVAPCLDDWAELLLPSIVVALLAHAAAKAAWVV